VAGDEEGDALRPDVLVRQPFAALLVDAGEHPAEQVGVISGGFPLLVEHGAALGDDPVERCSISVAGPRPDH
jgi:hypothetical protein